MSQQPNELVPTPVPLTEGPATVERVQRFLGLKDGFDTDRLPEIAAAVSAVVRTFPIARAVLERDPAPAAWPEQIVVAATMLGARLHRRKNSPTGVESFASDGSLYVRRNDPDISLLLELGEHARPAVG